MCSQVWVPSHPRGPCIGTDYQAHGVCSKSHELPWIAQKTYPQGAQSLFGRQNEKKKASGVQDLVWVKVKERKVIVGLVNGVSGQEPLGFAECHLCVPGIIFAHLVSEV